MPSKKIKTFSILIFIIVFLLSVKIADVLVGFYIDRGYSKNIINQSPRTIHLREIGFNQKTFVTPTNGYIAKTNGLLQKPYEVEIDLDGYLTSSIHKNYKSNQLNIIFLGGSSTESLFVDEDKRFPPLVGKMLSEKLNVEIKGINGAYSGNHSLHSLFSLIAKGIKQNPKIIVMMHNINDWFLLTRTGSYWISPESLSIIMNSGKSINEPSNIFRALINIKNIFIPNSWSLLRRIELGNAFDLLNRNEFRGFDLFEKDINNFSIEYKNSLKSFIGLCRSWNIEPVLMTQMHMFGSEKYPLKNVDYEKALQLQNYFNEIIRKVATENSVHLIDLDKELSGRDDLIYDYLHLNTTGSEKVAEIVSKSLFINYKDLLVSENN